MLLLGFLLSFASDQVLIAKNGARFTCDTYQRRQDLVLIRSGTELYSLPSSDIDWPQTRLAEQRRALAERQVSRPPDPERKAFGNDLPDFNIDKLDVKDASLIDVLRFLTDMAGINLVVDGSVEDSRATYFLHNIPWKTAFEIVIGNAGLDYQWLHGAVWIKPLL